MRPMSTGIRSLSGSVLRGISKLCCLGRNLCRDDPCCSPPSNSNGVMLRLCTSLCLCVMFDIVQDVSIRSIPPKSFIHPLQ